MGAPGGEREVSSLPTSDFADIDSPGMYVLHGNGLLARVPPDALAIGCSPVVSLTGRMPVRATRISKDPWLPVGQARSIAANHDLPINF